MQLIMKTLEDKISDNLKDNLEIPENLDSKVMNKIIKKITFLSIQIEAKQMDIDRATKEFENYLFSVIK